MSYQYVLVADNQSTLGFEGQPAKTPRITGQTSTPLSPSDLFYSLCTVGTAYYYLKCAQPFKHSIDFLPKSFLPVIVGKDGSEVFLYDFVEEWEEVADFDRLAEKFPNLTDGQIASAISYIRKLTQFNVRGIDMDDLEDSLLESSSEFQQEIREAIKEPGSKIVHSIE